MAHSPPPPLGESVAEDSLLLRRSQVASLIGEVLAQRATGKALTDSEIIARHPGLMPQLAEQLAAVKRVHQAQFDAARAGKLDQPIVALPMDELNASLLPLSRETAPGMEDCQVSIQGYQIIAEISHGGQATVYQAVQEATGRVVAVKVLSGGQAASSAGRIRFEREVKHLANLSHANIVGIIDRGRAVGGAFYLAMEFVDGPALDAYFAQQRPLAIPAVLRIFGKIARAMEQAHRQGIIHRDLKPANIRIDQHGEPRLLDFGLARLVSEPDAPLSAMPTITLPNQLVGSIPWASPEQVHGGTVDHRSDIYSFGFMLYYVVKGAYPFPAGNLLEALESVAHAQPVPLDSGLPTLDKLVAKCMQRRPENRYQSMAELLADLEAVEDRPRARWIGRARRWAALLGTAAVLAGLIWAIAHWGLRSAGNAPVPGPSATPRLTNSLGMDFVLVRHGFFLMGSPEKEPGRSEDETQHPVELTRDFYLGTTEVTERQYRTVMTDPPAASQPFRGDRAMGGISWQEATEFCRRLSATERRTYRLPTEAEWEYACRAGKTDAFGDAIPQDTGWFGLAESDQVPRIATKKSNAWGLFDMHGGVSEWCLDSYVTYSTTPVQNPQLSTSDRVRAGGSYHRPKDQCRAAVRFHVPPGLQRDPEIGFRILLEPP